MKIKTGHMKTVADLIKELQELPQDSFVVTSKDSEGNGYTPLADAVEAKYVPESTWSGELVDEEDLDEDEEMPEYLNVVCIYGVA